jgi:hypothetical protein
MMKFPAGTPIVFNDPSDVEGKNGSTGIVVSLYSPKASMVNWTSGEMLKRAGRWGGSSIKSHYPVWDRQIEIPQLEYDPKQQGDREDDI